MNKGKGVNNIIEENLPILALPNALTSRVQDVNIQNNNPSGFGRYEFEMNGCDTEIPYLYIYGHNMKHSFIQFYYLCLDDTANPNCPNEVNTSEVIEFANLVLGELGNELIDQTQSTIPTIFTNYDTVEEDGLLEKKEALDFLITVIPPPNTTNVNIVKEIKGDTKGYGNAGQNSMIFDESAIKNDLGVFLHELGHAKYMLKHLKDFGGKGKGPKNDTWDFMYRYTTSSSEVRGSRRFHWDKLKFF